MNKNRTYMIVIGIAVPRFCIQAFLVAQYHSGVKVQKSLKRTVVGGMVALLIRLEPNSFMHIHQAELLQSQVFCWRASVKGRVNVQAKISLRNTKPLPFSLRLAQNAPATVWGGKSFPWMKEHALKSSENLFHVLLLLFFSSTMVLYMIPHISKVFFFVFHTSTIWFSFLIKKKKKKAFVFHLILKVAKAPPWLTEGCWEIAAVLLCCGGMHLIVGGVTVWPSERNMWEQQQVTDFAENLVISCFFLFGFLCYGLCVCILL